MARTQDWLRRLLEHGESLLDAPPSFDDREEVLGILKAAFGVHALDVGGPPIAFDSRAALEATRTLADGCWRLVAEADSPPLAIASEPDSPAAHLSVDVVLRFLPAILRRASVREATHGLAAEAETLLRRWPLSGVLADLDGEPTTPPEFGGHSGLQMFYAERLVKCSRVGWVPKAGPAREWAERVYHERGKLLPGLC